jgi:hypothetical protein
MWEDSVQAGDFCINENGTYILCVCPCGCAGMMNLKIYPEGTETVSHPAWSWDGNREHPTLKPSIRDLSSCRFHGFLTQGTWTFEGDSGVKS